MVKQETKLLLETLGEIAIIIGAVAIGANIKFITKIGYEWSIFIIGIMFVFIGVALKIMPIRWFKI